MGSSQRCRLNSKHDGLTRVLHVAYALERSMQTKGNIMIVTLRNLPCIKLLLNAKFVSRLSLIRLGRPLGHTVSLCKMRTLMTDAR